MKSGTMNNAFLFLLGTVVLGQLVHTYTNLNLQPLLIVLTALILVFGALIIFKNSDELINHFEKIKERDETQKSESSKKYLIALACIVIAGILFRLVNINQIGMHYDEYWALVHALGTQHHGAANYVINGQLTPDDPRFSYTVWTIGWLFSVFGKSLLVARLPGIIMISLTAIPLYFLVSRINRLAGLTAAVLWLMSPWAIVMGRFFREYAYFPFHYVLVLIFLFWFAEYLMSLIKKEKKASILKLIGGSVFFIFPLIYSLVLARSTTFKLVIIPYGIAIVYFLYLMGVHNGKKMKPTKFHIVSGVLLFIVLALGLAKLIDMITYATYFLPHYNSELIKLAFENGPRNWFYLTGPFIYWVLIGLGILGALAMIVRKKFPSAFFIFLIFLGYIYAFTFHFNFKYGARYTFPIHLWSIPLLAIGIQILYWILCRNRQMKIKIAAGVLFFLTLIFTFNPINTYHSIYMTQSGQEPISGDYLYLHSFEEVERKYGQELRNSAILCWDCFELYWYDVVDLTENNVGRYNLMVPNGGYKPLDFMNENEHGWLILDGGPYKAIRKKELEKIPADPEGGFYFQGRKLEYVDTVAEDYLYRW